MNRDELKHILDLHKRWLADDESGRMADLSEANLSWADLIRANLSWANLSWELSGKEND
jgi:uncharacterized protein YjbI with pentapeptide repeats